MRDGRIAENRARGGRTGGDRVLDLTGLTVLPGYIDTHVHIGHHFDENGKLHEPEDQSDIAHMTSVRRRERLQDADERRHDAAEPGR